MNTTTTVSAPVALVFDATVATFEQDVILKSREVPVLVDFWATWCAPCKALGPILEKLTAAYGGAFLLAKVDIDREQQLAGYFQIRSVPTVLLLKDGRIAGGFQGAQPEGQVRRFLAQYGVEPAAAPAEAAAVDPAEAVKRLRAAAAADPDKPEIKLDLALALVAAGGFEEAGALLEGLPANLGTDARAVRARARIGFARLLADAPPRSALEQAVCRDGRWSTHSTSSTTKRWCAPTGAARPPCSSSTASDSSAVRRNVCGKWYSRGLSG